MGSAEVGAMVGVAETGSGYLLPEMEKARGVESVYLPMGRELAGQGSSGQAEAPTDGVQSSYLLPGLGQLVAATAKPRSVIAMAEHNSQLSSVFPVDGRAAFLLPAPCQDLLSNFLLPTINA